jgi:hypothetical protein
VFALNSTICLLQNEGYKASYNNLAGQLPYTVLLGHVRDSIVVYYMSPPNVHR